MILDMRKLQIKLFKQVYNLKRQLFKIEREMAEVQNKRFYLKCIFNIHIKSLFHVVPLDSVS